MPMPSAPKRRIIALGLLTVTLVLHFGFCRWTWGQPGSPVFAAWRFGPDPRIPPNAGPWTHAYYGIIARGSLPGPVAAAFGVALPLSLCFLMAYLVVHWRECRRSAAGLCASCGHPVGESPRCPECGDPVAPR